MALYFQGVRLFGLSIPMLLAKIFLARLVGIHDFASSSRCSRWSHDGDTLCPLCSRDVVRTEWTGTIHALHPCSVWTGTIHALHPCSSHMRTVSRPGTLLSGAFSLVRVPTYTYSLPCSCWHLMSIILTTSYAVKISVWEPAMTFYFACTRHG